MSTKRDTWEKHVRQWKASGLPAKVYAEQAGLNTKTLENWHAKLRRLPPSERKPPMERRADPASAPLPWVELIPPARPTDDRYEIELLHGRKLHVPPVFQAEPLRRLLQLLEERS